MTLNRSLLLVSIMGLVGAACSSSDGGASDGGAGSGGVGGKGGAAGGGGNDGAAGAGGSGGGSSDGASSDAAGDGSGADGGGEAGSSFALTSSAFGPMEAIPVKYTCSGAGTSPPLAWTGAPGGTKSFALVVDDPDAPDPMAPKTTFVHWVLYNIPDVSGLLPEGVGAMAPPGATAGTNDAGTTKYTPPCPPIGTHRYFFKLYALDMVLPASLGAAKKPALEAAMTGHTLAMVQLVGTFKK